MLAEGWRDLVRQAVALEAAGDPKLLELLAGLLEETDQAKQMLRNKGYGYSGMGIAATAAEVPEASS